jgi:hypothetical protein
VTPHARPPGAVESRPNLTPPAPTSTGGLTRPLKAAARVGSSVLKAISVVLSVRDAIRCTQKQERVGECLLIVAGDFVMFGMAGGANWALNRFAEEAQKSPDFSRHAAKAINAATGIDQLNNSMDAMYGSQR